MSPTITRLRFPDECRAIACLQPYRDGDTWRAPDGCALDILGPLDGGGWGVNILGPVPAKAAPFIVTPRRPQRVVLGEPVPDDADTDPSPAPDAEAAP